MHSFYIPVISQSISSGPTSVLILSSHVLPILFQNKSSSLSWLDWCLKPFQRVLVVLKIKSKILNMPTTACTAGSRLLLGPHLLSLCPYSLSFWKRPSSLPHRSLKLTIPLTWNDPTRSSFRAQLKRCFLQGALTSSRELC